MLPDLKSHQQSHHTCIFQVHTSNFNCVFVGTARISSSPGGRQQIVTFGCGPVDDVLVHMSVHSLLLINCDVCSTYFMRKVILQETLRNRPKTAIGTSDLVWTVFAQCDRDGSLLNLREIH